VARATSLSTPPVFQARHFLDVDEFEIAARRFSVEFTPLARKISVRQQILSLPDFDIVVEQSFPRLLDAQLHAGCSAICFAMEGSDPLRFNGVDVDVATAVSLGYGGSSLSVTDRPEAKLAIVTFNSEIRGRGWPEPGRHFSVLVRSKESLDKLRTLISVILKLAADGANVLTMPATSEAIKSSLLSALDDVFDGSDLAVPKGSLHSSRKYAIMQEIESRIRENISGPIYSETLANEVGVSVRTLHNVIMQYRGMSLHRYLRLKRLWLVRKQLLAGSRNVKGCAMKYGFWHLGEFSRNYHVHFGETPTDTIARSMA
jgi:AraC-like DNA-binding protein